MTHLFAQKVSWRLWAGLGWLAAAAILSVNQIMQQPVIIITWETASEVNTAGFHLYRSETAADAYGRITPRLIPAQGSAANGSQYRYEDTAVTPNHTYFYQLEEVTLNGETHLLSPEPIRHRAVRLSWWSVGATAVSAIIGITLILTTPKPPNE
ncbi:MAG: hypothetical protein KC419_08755 [Anaerolineales bacterium]|nr:hypothetical protein [Anaerolineales bacterium]